MSLLNADKYDGLSKYSQTAGRESGPFMAAFITGEPREGQDVGKMQIMADFDKRIYVAQNAEELYFVIMHIKRYWEKVENRNGRDVTVAFGWNDEPKLDDLCKFKYVISGLLLDPKEKFKKVSHPVEEGQDALIYFKCQGVKFGSAMDIIDTYGKKTEELEPLSDNPKFEKEVVTPRRFITKAIVTTTDSSHGKKYTYKFEPFKKLPDEVVTKFMDLAMAQSEEFEKQFNKTEWLSQGSGSAASTAAPPPGVEGNPDFSDGDSSEETVQSEEGADFDLGL